VGDWLTDGAIALGFGKYTSRYKNAKKITKKVEKEYGKKAIHVGHSLGGYLAENAASKNAEVHTINKHAVGFTGNVKNKNQYDYRKAGDLASLPSIFQTNNGKKRVQFGEFSINPLKSHEFNNL
jgi:pimeloyl-ACP methyl ester carboxylesterase